MQRDTTPPTGILVLADGTTLFGQGCGAAGQAVGEVCFNTAMSGHQEVLSDPSYADQIVCFTATHVGNVGANADDAQSDLARANARGAIMRAPVTPPSSWRSQSPFSDWMAVHNIVGLAGVDTRMLTHKIREAGMPHGVIAHEPNGVFDVPALLALAKNWAGIAGADLAQTASTPRARSHTEQRWVWPQGHAGLTGEAPRVVAVDFGVKSDIARSLASAGLAVEIVPDTISAADVLAKRPDGVVLSNGPGDPAATYARVKDLLAGLLAADLPILGVCLGHQLLALALGAKTVKMDQGHHGANHPVRSEDTGMVQIVSMNHGFTVDSRSLPAGVRQTHTSLFDGSNCGLAVEGKPIISVQHHPEAGPGPHDALGVFTDFAALIAARGPQPAAA